MADRVLDQLCSRTAEAGLDQADAMIDQVLEETPDETLREMVFLLCDGSPIQLVKHIDFVASLALSGLNAAVARIKRKREMEAGNG